MKKEEKLFYQTIGNELRTARKTKGMTLEEVGNTLGIVKAGISKIELGEQGVSLYQYYLLKSLYGLPAIISTQIMSSSALDRKTQKKIRGLIKSLTELISL